MATYKVECDTCNSEFESRYHLNIEGHVYKCEYCGNDRCAKCHEDMHENCTEGPELENE